MSALTRAAILAGWQEAIASEVRLNQPEDGSSTFWRHRAICSACLESVNTASRRWGDPCPACGAEEAAHYQASRSNLILGSGGLRSEGAGGSYTSIPDSRPRPYLGTLLDGGVFIDQRPWTEGPNAVRLALGGPMLSLALPMGATSEAPAVPDSMLGPGGLSGGFDVLARGAQAGVVSLDRVAPDVWLDWQLEQGARIAVRRGGSIVNAETGEAREIPAPETRWKA